MSLLMKIIEYSDLAREGRVLVLYTLDGVRKSRTDVLLFKITRTSEWVGSVRNEFK